MFNLFIPQDQLFFISRRIKLSCPAALYKNSDFIYFWKLFWHLSSDIRILLSDICILLSDICLLLSDICTLLSDICILCAAF